MRRVFVAVLVVGSAFATSVPAQSHVADHNVNFPVAGTVPCATVICTYWPPLDEFGGTPCENPNPTGAGNPTFVDRLTEAAPTPPAGKKMILQFETFPQVDWDTWICALLSNGSYNGGELAAGANAIGNNCDNILGPDNPVIVGCQEKASTPAEAGKKYVLRAYNYADAFDDPGVYRWVFV